MKDVLYSQLYEHHHEVCDLQLLLYHSNIQFLIQGFGILERLSKTNLIILLIVLVEESTFDQLPEGFILLPQLAPLLHYQLVMPHSHFIFNLSLFFRHLRVRRYLTLVMPHSHFILALLLFLQHFRVRHFKMLVDQIVVRVLTLVMPHSHFILALLLFLQHFRVRRYLHIVVDLIVRLVDQHLLLPQLVIDFVTLVVVLNLFVILVTTPL